ncbi:MAG: acyl-CoA desaturase [Chitinophagaceae bacterium]|nr:MAG: acyl-CoA desaturase [Chitinophagaceae bacterium]
MAKVTFDNTNNQFFRSLRQSVDAYFKETGLSKTGGWRLHHKALVLFPAGIALYSVLLLDLLPAFPALVACGLLGLVISSLGFNVMHDACHGSYSGRKWVNNLMGLTMNVLGGNAFFWKQKHNIIHHTYTNIEGLDDDIAQSKWLRQSPTQPWIRVHSYQHLYLTLAYGLSLMHWVAFRDFVKYFSGRVHNTPLPAMDLGEHVIFWISKAFYYFVYIILPIMVLGPLPWLAGYVTMNFVAGVVLSYTFQLAHAVEGPEFESVGDEDRVIGTEWAVHQLRTTANFAPRNRFVNWFVGGLNYQVEHHLFPRISHIHYPALSPIVQEHCRRFGIPYHSFPTVSAAIASHLRTMKRLGQGATELTYATTISKSPAAVAAE